MPDITATRPTAGAPIDTPWGQQVHDMLEGIQAGAANVVLATVNTQIVAIVFPRAYAVAPIVVAQVANTNTSVWIGSAEAITTTGCNLRVSHRDTGNFSGTIAVHWVAIGTPA